MSVAKLRLAFVRDSSYVIKKYLKTRNEYENDEKVQEVEIYKWAFNNTGNCLTMPN